MKTLARLTLIALGVTYLHLVFGGVVRLTGSGMGCGDHWPKCNGSWIPPFENAPVMIEWTHRLLALLVIMFIAALVFVAIRRRAEPNVGGARGVLRSAVTSLVLVIIVAFVGMVTVKLGNTTMATVAHWTLAMILLASLGVTAVRAGALGGDNARHDGGSYRAMRSIGVGAVLAFTAVVLGGVVAKFPGAAVACPGFPLCGSSPADVSAGAANLQLAHRVVAYLLFFHVLAISAAVRRRAGEAAAVKRATQVAFRLILAQVVLGAAMVLTTLAVPLRVLHQFVGIGVWIALFIAAYLARVAARRTANMAHGTWDMGTYAQPLSDIPPPMSQ